MINLSEKMQTPILVAGMHRSGTSLVSRLLEGLGVFMGAQQEDNAEATLFLKLNEFLLRQAGGTWDNPKTVVPIMSDDVLTELTTDYLRAVISGPRVVEYLGWKRALRSSGGAFQFGQWGWKDPRSTITLPIWGLVYPGLRVIWIRRNGLDVARSLVRRQKEQLRRTAVAYKSKRAWFRVALRHKGFTHSVRCSQMEGAFSLWEEYMALGKKHSEFLRANQQYCLSYEELIADPPASISRLAEFAGVDASAHDVSALARRVRVAPNTKRNLSPGLDLDGVRERLARWGYGQ